MDRRGAGVALIGEAAALQADIALRNNLALSLAISGNPQEAIAQLAPSLEAAPQTAGCARTSRSPTP